MFSCFVKRGTVAWMCGIWLWVVRWCPCFGRDASGQVRRFVSFGVRMGCAWGVRSGPWWDLRC